MEISPQVLPAVKSDRLHDFKPSLRKLNLLPEGHRVTIRTVYYTSEHLTTRTLWIIC